VTLRIRPEQLAALDAAMVANLRQRIVEHVHDCWPDECRALGDGVKTMVRDGMARAAEYGFTTEIDVAAFVDFTFLLGARFDTEEEFVRETLANPDLAPPMKIDWIEAWIDATDDSPGERA
jgi:hypothetical protein